MKWLIRLLVYALLGVGISLGLHTDVGLNAPPAHAQSAPQVLLQTGKAAYEAQQFTIAKDQFEQAVVAYAAQSDRPQQAQALTLQSLALQKLGQWEAAQTALDQSLDILESLTAVPPRRLAQALNAQGHLYLSTGQSVEALSAWEAAESAYRAAEDSAGALGSLINQVQAMQTLGFYHRAGQTLEAIATELADLAPSGIKAKGLLSLGNLLRLRGDLNDSRAVLSEGLAIAQSLNLLGEISAFHLSLGNVERVAFVRAEALGDAETASFARQAALDRYQTALETVSLPTIEVQILLNQLSLLAEGQQWTEVEAKIQAIAALLPLLPPSRATVDAYVNFAYSLMSIAAGNPLAEAANVPQWLTTAIDQAQKLKDERAISYAIGTLGTWYEYQAEWSTAQSLTTEALQTAQIIRAGDIVYQWQWQLGRIFQGKSDAEYQALERVSEGAKLAPSELPADPDAIRYYSATVETLEGLRRDLAVLNPDRQFSFRESVEPVYRDLVDLLLRTDNPTPQALNQVRDVIEALQLAELENYFREACVAVSQEIDELVDNISQPAAVLYPIILGDRLEIVLKLPQQPLKRYSVLISQADLEAYLKQLRSDLILPYTLRTVQSQSAQLYDWLIRPVEVFLAESQIDTVVFVLDGGLRNIPMGLLYDGQQYLIEKYSVAIAPGLQLVDPQPLTEQALATITAGLSEARHGFSPLPYVETEVNQLQDSLSSEVLLNQSFTEKSLAETIRTNPFPIVHLATHGQFSSNPEETFILAWDKPILLKTLNEILQNSEQSRESAIELLVLSACETATGDPRAALGLAGVAVRAGARSTLASLWSLDDETTAILMNTFYASLKLPGATRAKALQSAQVALLNNPRYEHPRYWAPYVLVGNWL